MTTMDLSLDDLDPFFWKKPTEYRSHYDIRLMGYLYLVCSIITLISNTFVILILTRKNMITSANIIFTHVVIAESLSTICYLPRLWHEFFRVTECAIAQHRTYRWELVAFYSCILAFASKHIGVWMTMMLAVWRYIAVIHPLKERDWCNKEITQKFVVCGYAFGFVQVLPLYFALDCGPAEKYLDEEGCLMRLSNITNETRTTTIYEFQVPMENYPILFAIGALLYGLIKLVPSIAFAVISYRLIKALTEARKRRQKMTLALKQDVDAFHTKVKQQTDRLSIILVIILALFATAEIPHGIYCLLAAFYGAKFFWRYHYYGQEIFNVFIQLSECFNFLIYYAMSHQFRKTCDELFRRKYKEPVSNVTSAQKVISSESGVQSPRENPVQSPSLVNELQESSSHIVLSGKEV